MLPVSTFPFSLKNGFGLPGLHANGPLGKASETSAEECIVRNNDDLHEKSEDLKRRLAELAELKASQKLADKGVSRSRQESAAKEIRMRTISGTLPVRTGGPQVPTPQET